MPGRWTSEQLESLRRAADGVRAALDTFAAGFRELNKVDWEGLAAQLRALDRVLGTGENS